VKVEMVDLFVDEAKGGGGYVNECINCVHSLSVR
jgi:hypothetical protein